MASGDNFYVYVADHPVTGEPCYVGKGRNRRLGQHNGAALAGKHVNAHLANIIRKYGPLDFVIVRAGLSEVDAFETERALIAQFGRVDRGTGSLANRTDGGDGAAGCKRSPEWVAASIARSKGRKASAETRQRISEANKRRPPFSAETRARLRAAHLGRKRSAEAIEKTASKLRGRKRPADACKKMSEAHKGATLTAEHKRNIGAALKGRTQSLEVKAKIRAARWGKHNNEINAL